MRTLAVAPLLIAVPPFSVRDVAKQLVLHDLDVVTEPSERKGVTLHEARAVDRSDLSHGWVLVVPGVRDFGELRTTCTPRTNLKIKKRLFTHVVCLQVE